MSRDSVENPYALHGLMYGADDPPEPREREDEWDDDADEAPTKENDSHAERSTTSHP